MGAPCPLCWTWGTVDSLANAEVSDQRKRTNKTRITGAYARTASPLPDPADVLRIHRRALLAVEGFAELVEVLHPPIHAELAGRVRVHLHHHARVLRAAALAPDLSVLDKELLRRCEAVFFGPVDVFALRGEGVLERQERDANAAVVRGVLTQRQLAVHVGTRLGREVVVLVHLAVGPLGEGLAVRRRLPLAQVALAVVLGAFVVEAMRHLVPDDHADAAEVLRRICRQRIERRLQNACGEVDVVHARLVVGVYGGGGD